MKFLVLVAALAAPVPCLAASLDGLWANTKFDPCNDGDGKGHVYIDIKNRVYSEYNIHCKKVKIDGTFISSKNCEVEGQKSKIRKRFSIKAQSLFIDGDEHKYCFSLEDNVAIKKLMNSGKSYEDAYEIIVNRKQ